MDIEMKQLQIENRKAMAHLRREFPASKGYKLYGITSQPGGPYVAVKKMPGRFFASPPAFLPGYEEPHQVDLTYLRSGGFDEANDNNAYGMSVTWPPYTVTGFYFLIELWRILKQYDSDVTVLIDEEIDKGKVKEKI